jgi:hypothetical protein
MMRLSLFTSVFVTLTAVTGVALADRSIIKHPGLHPAYTFEAEPHLLVEPFDDFLPGAGFRGTLELLNNGFVKTINNSIGLGFGADFTKDTMRLPIVMQWNFWLTENWSVFGEPGGAILIRDGRRGRDRHAFDHFAFYAGGRWHFTERMSLTMRIGRPAASVGVSFFL